jgi:hypothetical protein
MGPIRGEKESVRNDLEQSDLVRMMTNEIKESW